MLIASSLTSEPIVHYKKDCDDKKKPATHVVWAAQNPSSTTRRIATHGAKCHAPRRRPQNPSSTTRRIATVIANLLRNSPAISQNPSSTTRRIATRRRAVEGASSCSSEPIVHYKKDCDSTHLSGWRILIPQNPSSTTRRIATCSTCVCAGLSKSSEPIVHYKKDCDEVFLARCEEEESAQNPSSTTRRIATML